MANGGGGGFNNQGDIFDHFSEFFSGTGFDGFFNGGKSKKNKAPRGSDLRLKVKLTLEEIAKGVEKKLKFTKQTTCSTCNGSGAYDTKSFQTCSTCNGHGEVRQTMGGGFFQQVFVGPCPTCNGEGKIVTKKCEPCKGEGRVSEEVTTSVNIPAGVADGMQLSLRGNGNAGVRGGNPGDLILVVEEHEHENFVRDGDNIIHELFISFPDACLGTTVEVPTLTGKVKFKVDAGTQSGKIVRLKHKGLPNLNHKGTGDQLVHINVWTPQVISNDEKAVLEKMKGYKNFNPNPEASHKSFFERMKEFFK